ncbi:MAG: ferrous iron transport protein A [Gammaproteobacteria bacterium]|nr:MAG: ferrous iron transport protein A [Gammaproteobacteria bacterium]
MTEQDFPTFPLTTAASGTTVKVVGFKTGRNFEKRLISMGILRGSDIKVICNNRCCGTAIELHGSRMVLGKGMSDKIIVSGE